MKILFITDPVTVGGATHALIMLTRELVERKNEIIVCVSNTPEVKKRLNEIGAMTIETGHIPAMITKSRNKVKRLVKQFLFSWLRKIYILPRAIKRVEKSIDLTTVDIIHTNSARSDLGCLIAKRYLIPHVVHLREFGIEDYDCMFLRRNYFSYLNRNADAFIAVSDAVKSSWINKRIEGKKITTIYDGIDLTEIIPKTSYSDDCLKIVIVGGILKTKGQHICIKALRALQKSIRKKVTLDIIGWEDPVYRKYLDSLITKYGLQDKVRFLGVKDGVGNLLHNYDIGIMASKSEGFGLVTAEYMSAGLCVIASNSGANPELISDGINGLLFSRENYRELAKYIRSLYNDRFLMRKLAIAGKKKAEKMYSITHNAENIINLYNKTVIKLQGWY